MSNIKNLGFNLLEVLISITILSIGVFGIIALQIRALKFNHDSHLRTIATTQLTSFIDVMLTNPVGIKNSYYDNLSSSPITCNPCTSLDSAKLDFYNWNQKNAELLPNGQGAIVKVNNNYVLTIMWDQDRTGANGKNCSPNTNIDLTCLKIYLPII